MSRDHKRAPTSTPVRPVPPWRSLLLWLLLALAFCSLIGRALYLQWRQQPFLQQQGEARYRRTLQLPAHRGIITDRRGEPLAISTPVQTIWASPSDMAPVEPEKLRTLARLLNLPLQDLSARLSDRQRDFVYLRRQIDPELAERIMALHIPGIAAQREFKRYYPTGEVAAQLIGFTGIDGQGQEGIELAMNDKLAGAAGQQVVLKDRRGSIIASLGRPQPARDGQKIELAIDNRIQYLAFRAIRQAVTQHKARSGSVLVLDARSGELLAAAGYPSFNPNNHAGVPPEPRRLRGVVDQFESGSVMKPFAIALALEDRIATLSTVLDTHPYYIGASQVRDVSPQPRLDIAGIMHRSSNVGTSKLALQISPQRFWRFYRSLGFGQPAGSGFPGETSGKLRPWERWHPIDQATMSFGYGVSVNLLQLARAYTALTSDGVLLPVSLYKLSTPLPGRQVLSSGSAQAVHKLLQSNAREHPAGRVPGYSSGFKSGTARKLENGRYVANRHRAMFVGFAPGPAPHIIIAVTLDEPGAGRYYGGEVAAPVFADVARGALHILGIAPDQPDDATPQEHLTP
ncbi:penicillin-binding protein 2 [Paludibacterium sp. B53371]|uniref:peptidoglycan D,D-transpeptidase FtsI family protein n=1 Tax=Paludibacterium sp. B53371 TaxID=2806263 RepID=UPI001C03F5AB|nr:penicillin-binding transpeptidase domain-containing protein [Paludibacterium sp. B53371]